MKYGIYTIIGLCCVFILSASNPYITGSESTLSNQDSLKFETLGASYDTADMSQLALGFVGTPYLEYPLRSNYEHLTVNFQGVDGVTFVEQVLALWLTYPEGTPQDLLHNLQKIRYRQGVIEGYSSRLHYFSDWIYDNLEKGTIENYLRHDDAQTIQFEVNYMTKHPKLYPALKGQKDLWKKMRAQEKEISKRTYYFIPKLHDQYFKQYLKNGDIIAFTTDIKGLDIAHVGILYYTDQDWHVIHAPALGDPVEVSPSSLSEILEKNRHYTGFMVVRPKK